MKENLPAGILKAIAKKIHDIKIPYVGIHLYNEDNELVKETMAI